MSRVVTGVHYPTDVTAGFASRSRHSEDENSAFHLPDLPADPDPGWLTAPARITYQPASRYWAIQSYETAIFLALALALVLAGVCVWWVRRRRLS